MKKPSKAKILSIISAALLLITVLFQFMPFWTVSEDGSQQSTIAGVVWFPTDHDETTDYLKAQVREDFEIGQIIFMPIVTLILGAVGCVFCLFKPEHPAAPLFPTACGLVGMYGYLSEPVFRLGSGWALHLAAHIALIALGAAGIWLIVREIRSARSAS